MLFRSILNAPDYVLRIFLKKMHVSALCICLIFTLNLGNFARRLESQSSRLHACMLNIYSIISMTNNIPSHLVWAELFGAKLKGERGGGPGGLEVYNPSNHVNPSTVKHILLEFARFLCLTYLGSCHSTWGHSYIPLHFRK